MGKTQHLVQTLIDGADERLGDHGRIKTLMELSELVGETLYFVLVEARYINTGLGKGTYVPSPHTKLFEKRVDYFLKNNSGGGYKRFNPKQEIIEDQAVYVFEHGAEDGDYPMWEGVNVRLYNVPHSPLLYGWNAVFRTREAAEKYRLWCRMAYDGKGWADFMRGNPRYFGKQRVDRRQIMVKNRTKVG